MDKNIDREKMYKNNEYISVKLPKECIIALLVASKNYTNRIAHLEKNNRINDYKLSRIKATTLYDLNKAFDVLKDKVEYE